MCVHLALALVRKLVLALRMFDLSHPKPQPSSMLEPQQNSIRELD